MEIVQVKCVMGRWPVPYTHLLHGDLEEEKTSDCLTFIASAWNSWRKFRRNKSGGRISFTTTIKFIRNFQPSWRPFWFWWSNSTNFKWFLFEYAYIQKAKTEIPAQKNTNYTQLLGVLFRMERTMPWKYYFKDSELQVVWELW